MEKLRQRHRVEKQRSAAFSGERFISTWFYYEAMENGSNIEPGSLNSGPGILVKPLTAEKFEALAPKSTKRSFVGFGSNPQSPGYERDLLLDFEVERLSGYGVQLDSFENPRWSGEEDGKDLTILPLM
ncbi:hypothetical protein E3N88_13711 [Mikania micrantha]|uniref:Uncharacterized protein n=1 Tax=Mikania micrantha TaxID=192012 RepID=A0A5N6P120_9ASTR|nr:hypothetical protein E3N88_13711 [Mikania micrantha]